ncbi:hypothetical protein BMT55_00865 [Listeria newyorkensis]|uniref:Uncharacterized protein n=1 Tax=Listeria newyorkensis TaxID=1497681 RepID=A0ABX4XR19_9LIST|nr:MULTISPECIES: hypothetical protein [Listeria]KGL39088.1 hypothetical protein EP56_14320 [Listeriaceae bacterium FSL A5-0209]KGL43936.1 hypothetical protein EP58_05640 [Listeria newyorkensis]KMT61807.1 hypothetical protein X559_1838 [Listeria newyorkensis]PNP94933.1 hypothetical protein BMT55_00865 [Listeria newyorkensis]RQW66307.1 hypothetical protein DUK53_11380 [Listeria sp. SHR_NRA_18]
MEKLATNIEMETTTGKTPVQYHIATSNPVSEYLLVCFAELNDAGEPFDYLGEVSKTYDQNRLFLMPPAKENNKITQAQYEKTANELVESVAEKLKVKRQNIMITGYGESGAVAIYFGLRFHYNHTIAGDPKTLKNHYLFHQNVVKASLKGNQRIDKLFSQLHIEDFNRPHVYFYSGSSSQNYEEETKYMLEVLKEKQVLSKVCRQRNVGIAGFPNFLEKELHEHTNQLACEEIIAWQHDNKVLAECVLPEYLMEDKSVEFAYYFYKIGEKEALHKTKYQASSQYRYTAEDGGSYFVKVFIKRNKDTITKNSGKIRITVAEDF